MNGNGNGNREWIPNEALELYRASEAYGELAGRVHRRAKWICERCGVRRSEQIDHVTYARVTHEDITDLRALCRPCHAWVSAKRKGRIIVTDAPHADPAHGLGAERMEQFRCFNNALAAEDGPERQSLIRNIPFMDWLWAILTKRICPACNRLFISVNGRPTEVLNDRCLLCRERKRYLALVGYGMHNCCAEQESSLNG